MRYEFLGQVKAYTDNNDEVNRLQPLHRLLLAVLVLAEGPVSLDRLGELLWEGEGYKPQDPHDRLYHLKRDLDAALTNAEPGFPGVLSRDGRYQIAVERQRVDVFRFRDGVADARRARASREDAHAVSLWRAAIGEWGPYRPGLGPRGPEPLAGLRGMWGELFRNTLQAEYRTALTECLDAELRLGRHAELLPELNALFNADDASAQDEELAGLLMLGCFRSRQRDAALKTFRRLRGRLKENGLSPSRKLELLHRQVLNDDPALDLKNGAAMSSADASLGEFSATDNASSGAPEIPVANADGAEQATRDAGRSEVWRPRGQLFGDFYQLGENARIHQAEIQIFNERPEGA